MTVKKLKSKYPTLNEGQNFRGGRIKAKEFLNSPSTEQKWLGLKRRLIAALREDPGSVPSTYVVAHNCSDYLILPTGFRGHQTCMW